jgi:hypothetical protein
MNATVDVAIRPPPPPTRPPNFMSVLCVPRDVSQVLQLGNVSAPDAAAPASLILQRVTLAQLAPRAFRDMPPLQGLIPAQVSDVSATALPIWAINDTASPGCAPCCSVMGVFSSGVSGATAF